MLSAIFEDVYQGSNKANTVYFACPTATTNTVEVAFTLPDGTATSRHVMTAVSSQALSGVFDGEGNSFNVWKYSVPSVVTQKRGAVRVQFYITAPDSATVATALTGFAVSKGVSSAVPEIGDSYEELVALTSEYAVRLEDVEEDVVGKLDERNASDSYSAVYGYNQSEQIEFKVATGGATTTGHIPLYNANGSIVAASPSAATDAANKGYIDQNFGKTLELSINNSTYVLTLNLKNASGSVISTGSVDLPLESVVVGGSYDSTNKNIVLSLQSGNSITVPVGSLVSGLLEACTNDGTTTEVYVYSGQTQSHKTVSDSPLAGAVAVYSTGGVMKVSSPVVGSDAVNKSYADENYKLSVVKNTLATSVNLTPARNTEYYYGELTSVSLTFATSGASAGDTFYITFKSGQTATSITVNGSSAVFERPLESIADVTYEIAGIFNGTKWLVAWREL